MPTKLLLLAFLAIPLMGYGSLTLAQSRTLELQTSEGPLVIPLADGSVLELLGDGNVTASAIDGFICGEETVSCEDVDVSMRTADGGFFSSTRNQVPQGQSFQLSWSSRGAWECIGSGMADSDWNSSNPKEPTGVETVSTAGISPGSYELQLLCQNGPESDTRTVSVTVQDPSPDVCSGITELKDFTGWSAATDAKPPFGSSDVQTFSAFFGAWPGTGNNFTLGIRKNQYLALPFTTGTLTSSSSGQFNREQVPPIYESQVGGGKVIVSFSQCPGDFDPDSEANVCVIEASSNIFSLQWGGPGSGRACELQSNTPYYVNVLYASSAIGTLPPVQADCQGKNRCGALWWATGSE